MSEHIKQTISLFQAKLRDQEKDVAQTKHMINMLCIEAKLPPMYAPQDLDGSSGGANPALVSIRSDQFYGQPQATCVRNFLDMRKNLDQGPATVNEIYDALVEGGFAFDTKNPENAKRGLRISISKNTALFHKLPNGKIGLLEWYPKAKNRPKGDSADTDDGQGASE